MSFPVFMTLYLGVLFLLIYAPTYFARSYLIKGEAHKALRLYRYFSPLYSCFGKRSRATSAYNIAACYSEIGDKKKAVEWLNKALPLLKGANRPGFLQYYAVAMALSAFYHAEEGEIQEADILAKEARSDIIPKSRMEPSVSYLLAGVAFYAERFDEAETALKTMMEPSQYLLVGMKACTYSLLGSCAYYQGRFAEALQNQILAEKSGASSPRLQSVFLANQVIDATDSGDRMAAQQAEANLIQLLQNLEEAACSHPYRALSTLALARGDLDRALDYAERGYNQHATKRELANSLYLQASVYAQRKNYARALQLIEEAETYPNFTLYRERLANLRREVEAAPLKLEGARPQDELGAENNTL